MGASLFQGIGLAGSGRVPVSLVDSGGVYFRGAKFCKFTAPASEYWAEIPPSPPADSRFYTLPGPTLIAQPLSIVTRVRHPNAFSGFPGMWSGAFQFSINVEGRVLFNDGGGQAARSDFVHNIPGYDPAEDFWIKVEFNGTNTVEFYGSIDGASWTLLPNFDNTWTTGLSFMPGIIYVGDAGGAFQFDGRIYFLTVGTSGTPLYNFDAADYVSGTSWPASGTGETWNMVGNVSIESSTAPDAYGWLIKFDVGGARVYQEGIAFDAVSGAVLVADEDPVRFVGALGLTDEGAVCIKEEDATLFVAGVGLTAAGRLCVSGSGL